MIKSLKNSFLQSFEFGESNFQGSNLQKFLLFSFVILVFSFYTQSGFSEGLILDKIICNVVKIMQGNIARGIAIFAIIFIGISLFMGKVSWGLAIATGLGIGAMFGAQSIVEALGAAENGDLVCEDL